MVLPFTGLSHPVGVAMSNVTNAVYVADGGNNRVVKLAGNSPTQTRLPELVSTRIREFVA